MEFSFPNPNQEGETLKFCRKSNATVAFLSRHPTPPAPSSLPHWTLLHCNKPLNCIALHCHFTGTKRTLLQKRIRFHCCNFWIVQTKLHCGLKIQSECRLCETSLDWIGLDWVDWVGQGGLRVVATHPLTPICSSQFSTSHWIFYFSCSS